MAEVGQPHRSHVRPPFPEKPNRVPGFKQSQTWGRLKSSSEGSGSDPTQTLLLFLDYVV